LRRSDAAVVETPWVEDGVRRIPFAPRRIEVIPKAVECDRDLKRLPLPENMRVLFDGKLGKDAFTFLYVATNCPHKNFGVLISAMQMLKQRGENIRLALSLTEEDLRAMADLQANDLVSSGHILPLGWVRKEHLRDVYDNCSACVMPSLIECLSSSYLEAMQWGKPQICSDLPFAHDTCGSASAYADPNDPQDWAEKMLALKNDRISKTALVEEGWKRISQFPQTWLDVAKKFHRLFEDVLAEWNKDPMMTSHAAS
jgi:glycosyltransferase involved in cell wall biosynthesis